jgi:hypothetical protein
MIRWLSIYQSLLALACLVATSGCSGYEPQGQFWPANGGPLADTGGVSQGGAPSVVPPSDNGGGGITPAGGGNSVAGSNSAAGSDSIGGSNPAGGGTSAGGGNPAGGTSSAGGASSQGCSLSVTVTTTAPGGNYAPRNVGAIWVADSSGRFVKSLEVWGQKRIAHVVAWNAATKSAGVPGNEVDAITSATLSAHRTHNVTWNCRDYNEQIVPDGPYRVYFEVADSNSGGPNVFEPFTKGPSAATVQASMGNFQGIVLTFTP